MITLQFLSTLLTASILATRTTAGQYANGSAVASCDDFDCKRAQNESYGFCNLQSSQYISAGMVNFNSPLAGAPNLTWTEGFDVIDPVRARYAYQNVRVWKDYYLGTPPAIDLRRDDMGYHGCAAFFVDSNASFPIFQPPGTCSDSIGCDCVQALQSRAADAASRGSIDSANDLCSMLEDTISGNTPPSECAAVSLYGKSWGRVMFKPLTGPDAPVPATAKQSAKTDCHPVIPSSYQLLSTLNFTVGYNDSLWNSSIRGIPAPAANNLTVADYNYLDPRNATENVYYFIQYQAVPILSVFAPTGNNGSLTSAVSCIVSPWGPFLQKANAASRSGLSTALLAIAVLGACFCVL